MTRSQAFRGLSTAVVAVGLLAATVTTGAREQLNPNRGVTNIVLVHGAWADGSSWSKVIPLLQARGFNVVAVQTPLTSLADDVAAVKRALALEDGPVLLVAHSYGGVAITEAGNDPKVAGLVYIAAIAPQEGQSAFDLANAYPTPALQELRLDQFGFLKLTPTGIREDFAQDLSFDEQTVLAATQGPTAAGAALSAPVSVDQQNELVDAIAERVQVLGGVSIAMAPDVAEMTLIPRPPKGREEVAVQLSRLLHAHEIVLEESRAMARLAAKSGDDGSNDLIVSDVIRRNELQAWFVAEHLVNVPLTHASR